MEDKEADAPNYLRSLERKKVLSNIEQLGLLSAAEKAGLSLSKVSCLNPFLPPKHGRDTSSFPHLCIQHARAVYHFCGFWHPCCALHETLGMVSYHVTAPCEGCSFRQRGLMVRITFDVALLPAASPHTCSSCDAKVHLLPHQARLPLT